MAPAATAPASVGAAARTTCSATSWPRDMPSARSNNACSSETRTCRPRSCPRTTTLASATIARGAAARPPAGGVPKRARHDLDIREAERLRLGQGVELATKLVDGRPLGEIDERLCSGDADVADVEQGGGEDHERVVLLQLVGSSEDPDERGVECRTVRRWHVEANGLRLLLCDRDQREPVADLGSVDSHERL